MDLSQVKLVITDMDGTLLDSNHNVSAQFYTLFTQLKKHNVHFVAASGRQHDSIADKLKSIKKDITIISENGGLTTHINGDTNFTEISQNDILNILDRLKDVKNSHIILCGKNSAYIASKDSHFNALVNEYYVTHTIVDDLTAVTNDVFMKVAIYHETDSETGVYPFVKQLENNFKVKVSGKNWVDISHEKANKGHALRRLQKQLNISANETMAFGDYNNDLEMLNEAYFSYAMSNAHPNVKNIARFETKSNDNNGVEYILEQLIKAKNS